jgi:hypothetical protein
MRIAYRARFQEWSDGIAHPRIRWGGGLVIKVNGSNHVAAG